MDKTVHVIYFSPAHSTRQVVKTIAQGISATIINHDITQGVKVPIELSDKDIAVIGIPVYSGRVPALAAKYLGEINANQTPAIVVCVYGNREYDDALVELKNICTAQGFLVVSAGAFIARHSIFPMVAQGRPDVDDLAKARDFGARTLDMLINNRVGEFSVKGNVPYREVKPVPLSPSAGHKCDRCGVCAACCPVGAIDKENPKKTDSKKCIACARCIEVCPQNARNFRGLKYKLASKMFYKKFHERKEAELFFSESAK